MAIIKQEALVVVGVALAVLGLAWYAKRQVAGVLPYVNPADPNNIINQGAIGFYQGVTGSTGTIGGDFYDATHGGMLSNGTFNPTSTNNAIYSGITDLFGGESLGTKIYDWWH
jgi:hypothetical protein